MFDFSSLRSSVPLLRTQFLRIASNASEEEARSHREAALPELEGFTFMCRLGKGGIRGWSFLARDENGFEVRAANTARDDDLNRSPSPASVMFTELSRAHCPLVPLSTTHAYCGDAAATRAQVVLKEYLPDRLLDARELSAALNRQRHCMLEHPNVLPVREFFVTDANHRAGATCWSPVLPCMQRPHRLLLMCTALM